MIIGGGFGGCEAALRLARAKLPDTRVRLLEPKTYFEYHAALYRFATGTSPMETCIPYADIFSGKEVDVVRDAAKTIDLKKKSVLGESGSQYGYDTLILALGSSITTFGIEGVANYSFGMKSALEALRIKNHIQDSFDAATIADIEKKKTLLHMVITGGGASGVELAGEISVFGRKLAHAHGLSKALLQIDLIEAEKRLLSGLPEAVSNAATKRLRELGVRVLLSQRVCKQEEGKLFLEHSEISAATVVWTAGMCGHTMLKNIADLQLDRKGRVEVDEHLQSRGNPDVYVLGDSASTPQSGMAQTALYDGWYISEVLRAKQNNKPEPVYKPPTPVYAVPVGSTWAVVLWHSRIYTGTIGWMLRRMLDLKVFIRLLPFSKALRAFACGNRVMDESGRRK